MFCRLNPAKNPPLMKPLTILTLLAILALSIFAQDRKAAPPKPIEVTLCSVEVVIDYDLANAFERVPSDCTPKVERPEGFAPYFIVYGLRVRVMDTKH